MAVNPIVIIGGIALVGVVASMMGDDEAEAEEDLESLDFPIDPVPGPGPGLAARLSASSIDIGVS